MWWGERLKFWATILDDAGVRHVTQFTDQSPQHDLEVRREYQHLILTQNRPLLAMWGSLVLLLIIAVVWTNVADVGVSAAWFVVPTALVTIPLGIRFQQLGKRALRSSRLRRGLCPACVYGLQGVPTRADGLTICPECSAAWRIDAPAASTKTESTALGPADDNSTEAPPAPPA